MGKRGFVYCVFFGLGQYFDKNSLMTWEFASYTKIKHQIKTEATKPTQKPAKKESSTLSDIGESVENFVSIKVNRVPRHSAKKTDFVRFFNKTADQALNSPGRRIPFSVNAYGPSLRSVPCLGAKPVREGMGSFALSPVCTDNVYTVQEQGAALRSAL